MKTLASACHVKSKDNFVQLKIVSTGKPSNTGLLYWRKVKLLESVCIFQLLYTFFGVKIGEIVTSTMSSNIVNSWLRRSYGGEEALPNSRTLLHIHGGTGVHGTLD